LQENQAAETATALITVFTEILYVSPAAWFFAFCYGYSILLFLRKDSFTVSVQGDANPELQTEYDT
jgi:hypothetical protein